MVINMNVTFPYGHSNLSYNFESVNIITSKINELKSTISESEIVAKAMSMPIGSRSLRELATNKRNATIIISDHTRPVPSRNIIPHMLTELREGNPEIDITLLVATGCHRETTEQELIDKLGEDIVKSEKIVIHNAFDANSNVTIGTLPSGAPLVIDRIAAETELLVAEGFIEPHFFAGFSGGRKSVLPGICDRVTVLGNHCGSFISNQYARTGILENNPIHRDMDAAAEIAKLAYIVNVIIDENKRTVAAFAGDFRLAHKAGVDFLRKYCEVDAIPADIVITTNGGAPLDQNLYQCVKGLTAAEASAKPGATLILCAELADGIGGEGFYNSLKNCADPALLYDTYSRTPQNMTISDQWQSQILCRILMKHRVIFVTRPEMAKYIQEMKMDYAATINEAILMANGKTITAIPNGISVIVKSLG